MVFNLAVAGISFRNEILSLLQESDIAALRPHLNHVTLTSNQVLHEANGLIAECTLSRRVWSLWPPTCSTMGALKWA
jgi:hypothetical protein